MGYPHKSHPKETPILSKYFGEPQARTLDGWKERGGYRALQQALGMTPADIVNVLKESGLRGRGGAGFPTGMQWSFMKPGDGKAHYLCVQRRRVRAGHVQGSRDHALDAACPHRGNGDRRVRDRRRGRVHLHPR